MTESPADSFLKTFEGVELPDAFAERFQVEGCLARGAYGDTYLLAEKGGEKLYVLKCCQKTDETPQARNEAALLRALSHKGLTRFEEELERDGTVYTLREFADGIPLDQYLSERAPDAARVTAILKDLCEILTYLHSRPAPVIHRDIKPSNVIIGPDDHSVTLIDFGISRKYNENADADTTFSGTEPFVPPEQYGFQQTDCRSDLYALGILMRYMLTGDAKRKIPDGGLERVARKCAAFSPKERFRSAEAVRRALIRAEKRVRQKTIFAAVAALALCAAFFAGFAAGRFTDFLSFLSLDSVYVFTDPAIEKSVRLALNKNEDEPVMSGELSRITRLLIVGNEVVAGLAEFHALVGPPFFEAGKPYGTVGSLEDCAKMPNLSELYLFAQPLSDLSPLSASKNLISLELMHTRVADASPLYALPRLENLTLYDSLLEDFSFLAGLKSLRSLGLGGTIIRSLADLGDIYHLISLNLDHTWLENLDGIERFEKLSALSIGETLVTDLSPLDNLPYLEQLSISRRMERYLDTLTRGDLKINIF